MVHISHAAETTCAGHGGIRQHAGTLALALFLVVGYGAMLIGGGKASVGTLSLVFASIVLEAIPFMLVGALVGGLIEVFVSRERMTALLPKRGWVTVMAAAGMGIIFPVCECAVVPVVRRLGRKGLPAAAAIAYLLGGPIVNPIVAASTALAYRFDWNMVIARVGFGYLIAVGVALAMGKLFEGKPVFHQDIDPEPIPPSAMHGHVESCSCGCHHTHAHDAVHHHQERAPHVHSHDDDHGLAEEATCSCGHDHATPSASIGDKIIFAFRHAGDDFLAVGHFLVIGAFIAALAQAFVERRLFLEFATYPIAPSLAMMALAVALNLCSEADAFIAASFRGLMPFPAQLAFLLTGPMFDLKLLLMYQGVFRKRAIVALASLILVSVLMVCAGVEMMGGGL